MDNLPIEIPLQPLNHYCGDPVFLFERAKLTYASLNTVYPIEEEIRNFGIELIEDKLLLENVYDPSLDDSYLEVTIRQTIAGEEQ